MSRAESTLADLPRLAHLAPPVIGPDARLEEIVDALSRDPGSGLAFVTGPDGRLLGVIPERALDADLIALVLPQAAVSSVVTLGRREALRASHGRAVTAGELMSAPRTVTPETTLSAAIASMWRAEQRVAPLVDAEGALLGYVALFELLAAMLRSPSARSGR
ncbi:MAG TPA: CBS domain-containing protein [Candidatus Limnocylindria bacterium]